MWFVMKPKRGTQREGFKLALAHGTDAGRGCIEWTGEGRRLEQIASATTSMELDDYQLKAEDVRIVVELR